MSINWALLVATGRAKAHGISWTEEEAHARFQLGIPAAFVRDGILTLEDYEKANKKDKKNGAPNSRKTRKQLETAAKKHGVDFTPEVTDAALGAAVDKAEAAKKTEKRGANKKK